MVTRVVYWRAVCGERAEQTLYMGEYEMSITGYSGLWI